MDENDLVFKVASRARSLANKTVLELRLSVGTADTVSGAVRETRHMDRGELIEAMLVEEFAKEFPREICEE